MKASEINNNPLTKAWEKRFSQLTVEKQQRILELEKKTVSEYQLNVIKRTRSYPEVGDIFDINPKDDVIYQGLVINNHIDNLYGKDLIIVIIFNNIVLCFPKRHKSSIAYTAAKCQFFFLRGRFRKIRVPGCHSCTYAILWSRFQTSEF